MDKEVKITIQYCDGSKQKLVIRSCFMRKISLRYNGKFEGFYPFTKIMNKLRKNIVVYFNGSMDVKTNG